MQINYVYVYTYIHNIRNVNSKSLCFMSLFIVNINIVVGIFQSLVICLQLIFSYKIEFQRKLLEVLNC